MARGRGRFDFVVWNLQTPSNSIERKSSMEFRNQKVSWNSLGLCLKGTEKEIYEFIYLLSILQSRLTFLVLFEKFYCLAFKTSKIFIFSLNIMCIK